MSWQERILDYLWIHKAHSKLVLDRTGVLTHRQFLSYIRHHSFNFAIASELPDILKMIRKQGCLVIAPFIQIPSYLDGKIDIQILDYPNLPIEIDYAVAKTLSVDQLTALLAYRHQTGEIHLITANAIAQELTKAHLLAKKMRVAELSHDLKASVQTAQSYDDLLTLGQKWGEYIYACFETGIAPDRVITTTLDQSAERIILSGELKKAFYAPESRLKTVNKIRPYLEQKTKDTPKLALVCFDGMGVAEWVLIKTCLADFGFKFSERYLFALIPTITKISRSAIFYGDCVSVYALKTPEEAKQFANYFPRRTCCFFREGEISSKQQHHLLGIDLVVVIYNFLDNIAHKTQLPPGDNSKTIYFKNIQTYLNHAGIQNELGLLKQSGYAIRICSDHGCVAGHGNGQRIDKYLIETSSQRATLIAKTELSQFYDVHQYQIPFLSDDKIALLAKNRTLFAPKKYYGISHGGITLEELIVPFAEVIP